VALFGGSELPLKLGRREQILAVDRLGLRNLFDVTNRFLAFVQFSHDAEYTHGLD
jgi:hypothetical protein